MYYVIALIVYLASVAGLVYYYKRSNVSELSYKGLLVSMLGYMLSFVLLCGLFVYDIANLTQYIILSGNKTLAPDENTRILKWYMVAGFAYVLTALLFLNFYVDKLDSKFKITKE